MDPVFKAAAATLPKKDDAEVLKLLDYGISAQFEVRYHPNALFIVRLLIIKNYSHEVIFKALDCGFEFDPFKHILSDCKDIPERMIFYEKCKKYADNVKIKKTHEPVYKEHIQAFITNHKDDTSAETLEEFDQLVSMTLIQSIYQMF